jgi:hypothetical protein
MGSYIQPFSKKKKFTFRMTYWLPISPKEIAQFRSRPATLQSITVYAEKPL